MTYLLVFLAILFGLIVFSFSCVLYLLQRIEQKLQEMIDILDKDK